jgi:hypothetical protein
LFGLFFCRDLPNNRFEYVVDFVKFRLLPRRWELAAQHPPPFPRRLFLFIRAGEWPGHQGNPDQMKIKNIKKRSDER